MMKWFRALFRRRKPQIPAALWHACVAQLPLLHALSREALARLKNRSEAFLARVPIHAAGGFELSNQASVLIAMQASYLVLNLTLDLYDDIPAVIIYPSGFIVDRKITDGAGIVHEWREPLAGEAIQQGGAIVLSWEDVENTMYGGDGRNVVIHEFAHKIDMKRGFATGYPPFLSAYHQTIKPLDWQRAFSAAFDDFTRRVEARHSHHSLGFDEDTANVSWIGPLPLDPYGATNAAEFFAVASESLFLRPAPLAAAYPEVYSLLARYYHHDPLARTFLRH